MSPDLLIGCDFSSSPSRRKPIVMAAGSVLKGRVLLAGLERLESLDSFEHWLRRERHWLGAFDFPFGLPRELVVQLDWPMRWPELIGHYAALSRPEIRNTFADFCAARPAGKKICPSRNRRNASAKRHRSDRTRCRATDSSADCADLPGAARG